MALLARLSFVFVLLMLRDPDASARPGGGVAQVGHSDVLQVCMYVIIRIIITIMIIIMTTMTTIRL